MALASRQFQLLCLGCLFLTSVCVTITSFGSFENGTAVNLTCTNQPYLGTQIWTVNTVEVLNCGVTSCAENNSNQARFSFVNDRGNGVFIFTIDPILRTDDGSVVGCKNGTIEDTFSIIVEDKLDSPANDVGSIATTKTLILKLLLFIHLVKNMTHLYF